MFKLMNLLRGILTCIFILTFSGISDSADEQGTPMIDLCGNSIIEAGEECDDGGTSSGDGCSSDCLLESGWMCSREPSFCMYDVPYPPSEYIVDIDWDLSTHVTAAPGSDLWPVTWASDGNLYTSWGDGGGFGGTGSDGRVSLGFGRIEGQPESYQGYNVWGGKDPENPAQFSGKSSAIISVNGTLYAWINTQIGDPPATKLAWSDNLGATWQMISSWSFPSSGGFFPSGFMNAGRDNADAKDNYVYAYGARWQLDGFESDIYMIRIPNDQIKDRTSYEFLSGFDAYNNPTWSTDINDRALVFSDPNGVGNMGLATVDYNPGIDRYIFTVAHRPINPQQSSAGRLGVFEGPNPWGPWSTVAYYDNWLNAGDYNEGLGWTFPGKWISPDGLTMWCVFSCWGCNDDYNDKFNLIKATITLSSSQPSGCTSDLDCDDGLFCNGAETCDAVLGCQPGIAVDCSGNDLPGIDTCVNSPDGDPFTKDFFPGFISTCDEQSDSCTTNVEELVHSCDITNCGAECEIDADCDDGNIETIDTCNSECVCQYQVSNDTTPPTPDPMTWAIAPYATGPNSISMTAATASDENGAEYYFISTDGGNDSDWQGSPTYEDFGLQPETLCTYQVMARDKSANKNETGWSSPASALTVLPSGGDPVVAWTATDQNPGGSWSNSGWDNRSFRILLDGAFITTSGLNVQLTLRGRSSGSYTVQRVSLVQRDGNTLNGVDSTNRLVTFGGSWDAGVTVPAGGTMTSDPIPVDLLAGQDMFLTFWAPPGNSTVYRTGGASTSAWALAGTDQSATIDWEGLSISDTLAYVYIIEQLDVIGTGNDNPVANDDTAATDEDTPVTIDVLGNDSDNNGDTLSVDLATDPANGSVVNNGTEVNFTPDADFNGSDTFTYTVSDGHGGTDTATVTVTVNPANDDPVASDDAYSVEKNNSLIVDAPGVLGNDSDADGDTLTALVVVGPTNGALELDADGSFTYTPFSEFTGTDSFMYTANDGEAGSNEATVTITVNPEPPPNLSPTVYAGPDQTVTLPDSASLDGTVTDDGLPVGSTVTTTWSMQSGDGTVAFGNTAAVDTTAGFSGDGTYVLRLEATDGDTSAFDEVTITVDAEAPKSGGCGAAPMSRESGRTNLSASNSVGNAFLPLLPSMMALGLWRIKRAGRSRKKR